MAMLPWARAESNCGLLVGQARIIGGNELDDFKYPWFAQLLLGGKSDQAICAGSLISPRHILTAAHCFDIMKNIPNYKKYAVRLGTVNQCGQDSTSKIFKVKKAVVHPNYKSSATGYDLAVMTLTEPANYMPICLPGDPREQNRFLWILFPSGGGQTARSQTDIVLREDGQRTGIISGFGTTRSGDSSSVPCVMREAIITIFNRTECINSMLPREDATIPGTICAGKMEGGIDSCQGDSGGPLITLDAGVYIVYGIVSFGFDCAKKGMPGIYTHTIFHKPWILNQMEAPETPAPSAVPHPNVAAKRRQIRRRMQNARRALMRRQRQTIRRKANGRK